ncbi:MAG: DUF2116 family Zn-ribbon domain-containing protein [Nanoarchaeota archaeon]
MFSKKKKGEDHKFCPSCGTKLSLKDTYCIRCGYSFQARVEKNKGSKKKNFLIVVILLVIAYFGLRYTNNQTIIPTSFADAIRTFLP